MMVIHNEQFATDRFGNSNGLCFGWTMFTALKIFCTSGSVLAWRRRLRCCSRHWFLTSCNLQTVLLWIPLPDSARVHPSVSLRDEQLCQNFWVVRSKYHPVVVHDVAECGANLLQFCLNGTKTSWKCTMPILWAGETEEFLHKDVDPLTYRETMKSATGKYLMVH